MDSPAPPLQETGQGGPYWVELFTNEHPTRVMLGDKVIQEYGCNGREAVKDCDDLNDAYAAGKAARSEGEGKPDPVTPQPPAEPVTAEQVKEAAKWLWRIYWAADKETPHDFDKQYATPYRCWMEMTRAAMATGWRPPTETTGQEGGR